MRWSPSIYNIEHSFEKCFWQNTKFHPPANVSRLRSSVCTTRGIWLNKYARNWPWTDDWLARCGACLAGCIVGLRTQASWAKPATLGTLAEQTLIPFKATIGRDEWRTANACIDVVWLIFIPSPACDGFCFIMFFFFTCNDVCLGGSRWFLLQPPEC